MRRIKKGDEVIVQAGKDKGRRGTVLRVLANDKVVVENVNVVKRHTKPNPARGTSGGIVDKEMPIHVSNVMVISPDSGQRSRVGIRVLDDGRKVRVAKVDGAILDR